MAAEFGVFAPSYVAAVVMGAFGAAVVTASSCSQRAISLARAPRTRTRTRSRQVVEADMPPSTLRFSVALVRK